MSISDLKNDDYDRGWMDGRDSAENEFENFGRIPRCIGGSKWCAIKHQIRGIIHILRFKGEQR
jgi:hypothetical protein